MRSRDEVSQIVIGVLQATVDGWGLGVEKVTEATWLNQDLSLTSVDMLEVMAALDVKLGRRFKYERLVMRDGRIRTELQASELTDFVFGELSGPSLAAEAIA
jgi:acyl carrier protein